MPTVTVTPASGGGQLMTRCSSSVAGVGNWVVKRNWMRDLDQEFRRHGIDLFIPLPGEEDKETQPYPAAEGETINLVHLVRRPNGEAAVVVGTATTLYRFNLDLEGYVGDYGGKPYVDDYSGEPYFEDPDRWRIIGSGFSEGGNRWEAVSVNGTTVFNNGVDLPVAYRLEWDSVVPLYELREQGILSVGTITEHQSMLMCADITELVESDLDTALGLLSSGAVTLTQTGRRESGTVTATMTGGGTGTVTASSSFFTNTGGPLGTGDVGRIIVWPDGQRVSITAYTSATQVTVAPIDAGTVTAQTLGAYFYVSDLPGTYNSYTDAYSVTASGSFFTASMVGKVFSWADGKARIIMQYISATHVKVDRDVAHSAGVVQYENPDSFSAYVLNGTTHKVGDTTIGQEPNRRQNRVLWSLPGDPTRFASEIPVTATAGSTLLTASRIIKSLSVNQAVAAASAGVNGGVLITTPSGDSVTITDVAPGFVKLSYPAQTSTSNGYIQAADSVLSLIGYDDLQDDGSGILKMLTLQDRLVIYKDTSIFLGRFTGNSAQPFIFEMVKIPHGQTLHYRYTLANVDGFSHIYAGRTSFYVFDLTSRMPRLLPKADLVQNLFFDYATFENTDSIFACDNQVTQELYFVCPQNTTDPVLCYDYRYGTFSTSDMAFTAGSIIKAPLGDIPAETEDWFVMGNANGTVLLYGATTAAVPLWYGEKEIFYRRTARPYSSLTNGTYTSTLKSGLGDFGDEFNEKHMGRYVLQFSSQQEQTPRATIRFHVAKNQSAEPKLFGQRVMRDGDRHGMIPTHIQFHNLQDEIVVTGYNNPMRLHGRVFDIRNVSSRSSARK